MKRMLCVLATLVLATGAMAEELIVNVAASSKEVMRTLCHAYETAHPGVTVVINAGASGTLARQIEQGQPADLFLSANTTWTAWLVEKGKVAQTDVHVWARNELVVVGAKAVPVSSLADLAALNRISLGSPASVPAGAYAKAALQAARIWDKLEADGKLVFAKDVRQALLYAERGEVDAAFVYRTDALLAKDARVLYTVPAALYPPIAYPLALTTAGSARPEARGLLEFLLSKAAEPVLTKAGFAPPDPR